MKYLLMVDKEDLDDYLKKSMISDALKMECFRLRDEIHQDGLKGIKKDFVSEKHKKAYEGVLADLAKVQESLDTVLGSPKEICPKIDKEVVGTNGYKFERMSYLAKHLISISGEGLSWTIGVRYEGTMDDEMSHGKCKITGYYLMSNPFSFDLFNTALENTQQFFPCDNMPHHLLRKECAQQINDVVAASSGVRHLIFSYLDFKKPTLEDRLFCLKIEEEMPKAPGGPKEKAAVRI